MSRIKSTGLRGFLFVLSLCVVSCKHEVPDYKGKDRKGLFDYTELSGMPAEVGLKILNDSLSTSCRWWIANSEKRAALQIGGGDIQIVDYRIKDVDRDRRDDFVFIYKVHYGAPIWCFSIVFDYAGDLRVLNIEKGTSQFAYEFGRLENSWGFPVIDRKPKVPGSY